MLHNSFEGTGYVPCSKCSERNPNEVVMDIHEVRAATHWLGGEDITILEAISMVRFLQQLESN